MSGHLTCTVTLSLSRHISTLNYLRSADTGLTRTRTVIYWLYVPAIADSANKCRVSLVISTQNQAIFHTCVMNHVIVAVRPFGYICFTTSRRKSHVFCVYRTMCVKPAMSQKRTILSFYQCASCRTLAIELVRQNANRSKQSEPKEPSWPNGIQAAVLIMKYMECQKLTTSVRGLYNNPAVIL